jgi:hypothetical protein
MVTHQQQQRRWRQPQHQCNMSTAVQLIDGHLPTAAAQLQQQQQQLR